MDSTILAQAFSSSGARQSEPAADAAAAVRRKLRVSRIDEVGVATAECRLRRLAHDEIRSGFTYRRCVFIAHGSQGRHRRFRFLRTYTNVVEHKLIESTFGGRVLLVEFIVGQDGVTVREIFDAELTHSVEQPASGLASDFEQLQKTLESKR